MTVEYVGRVGDFDGTSEPLNLTAGRHHLELAAPGYAPMAFDVDVVPGQLVRTAAICKRLTE